MSERTVRTFQAAAEQRILARKRLAIESAYERLRDVPVGPPTTGARRGEWAGPDAWDDSAIDDPNAAPRAVEFIDPVLLDRALSGTRVTLSKAEQHHAVHRGVDQGMPLYLVAERLHMSYSAAKSYRRRPLPDGYELAA